MPIVPKRQADAGPVEDILPPSEHGREFHFSDADFRSLVVLAREHTGIALSDSKRNLVYGRLSRRLRALGFDTFREYRDFLQSPAGEQEIERFINSISTNLTKLFRESHHFDHFRTHVAAAFAQGRNKFGGKLRIWSAGCSTGEEPYSIASVLRREITDAERLDVKILATDIDTDVIAKGSQGEYSVDALSDVPAMYREFMRQKEKGGKAVQMGPELRNLISFKRLNLMDTPWPFHGKFDAIFCRNVMIYFDGPTKANLIDRFIAQIKPDGWLYIGHSESLLGSHPNLELMGRTIYRRIP
jgi:chemotaxis protein methyltransferase CheR